MARSEARTKISLRRSNPFRRGDMLLAEWAGKVKLTPSAGARYLRTG